MIGTADMPATEPKFCPTHPTSPPINRPLTILSPLNDSFVFEVPRAQNRVFLCVRGFQGSKPCASTLMFLRVMRAPRAQRLVLLRLFCYCYRYGYCKVMRRKPPVIFGVVILSPAEQGIRSPLSCAVFLTQNRTFHRRADHRFTN